VFLSQTLQNKEWEFAKIEKVVLVSLLQSIRAKIAIVCPLLTDFVVPY